MKKITFFMVFIACILVACSSDSASKIEGAWKSEKVSSFSKKPDFLIFSKGTLSLNGKTSPVDFDERDGIIFVKKDGYVIMNIRPQNSNDELFIERIGFISGKFTRTTPDEIEKTLALP